MNESANAPQVLGRPPPPSLSRLADFIGARLACEQVIVDAYRAFLDKCRRYSEPAVELLELAKLERFRGQEAEHAHLLDRVMEALDTPASGAHTDRIEGSRRQVLAIAAVIGDPAVGLLPSLQALLTVEQIDEAAWGLLLALVKEAELAQLVPHLERICAQQRAHRVTVQQRYETLSLRLLREDHLPAMLTGEA